MNSETRKKLREIWRHAKWAVWGAFFGAFLVFVVFYLLPSTRSRWNVESTGGWTVFTEKSAPSERTKAFIASYPAAAKAWFKDIGLEIEDPAEIALISFASWEGYGALDMNDPLIRKRLSTEPSSDLRFISMAAKRFRLNEPVAASFVTADGRYLFLDLKGDTETAAIHGIAHVLARRNTPRAMNAKIDFATASSYDPAIMRAFNFVDETTALFLSDFHLSGAAGKDAEALARYEAFFKARYAPDGPIFRDENLTFTFSSDPRSPRYFAEAARFALAISKDKGLPAMLDLASRFLDGDYSSLEELFAPLGGKLDDLLERYLGARTIPE